MRVNAHYQGSAVPRYHVSVNGVDVTNVCYEADDKLGVAWCFRREPSGHYRLHDHTIIERVELTGHVHIWRQ